MSNQTVAAGAAPESGQPGHVSVDLFQGWSPAAPPSASASAASDVAMHLKRSSSHEGSSNTANAAPAFQSISFPSKDTGLTAALYAHTTQDDEEELERIKLLPPSKRPGVSHAKKTPPNHIKRPRNAYIIFRSHTVSQKLIPKEVEHDHRNISRIIAHMWKSLSPEDRAHYEQMAKEEKERHKLFFPDYRYQPTTRREGVSKRNVKKLENGEEECQEIADIILKAQGKDGVVVRAGPSKAMKRAREATRSCRKKSTTAKPARKRARTTKSTDAEPEPSEQTLETVFLHPSPSHSPNSAASAGCGAVPAPSPEPFRLSRTSSIDEGEGHTLAETSPSMDHLLERRASSVPLLRPCSPPPPFVLESPLSLVEGAQTSDASADVAHASVGLAGPSVMPAPAWKGRKAQPPPIPNTWQHCSYDDQSLPSPRSFDALATFGKTPMGRPRTACPSTPSSGSFRGFFHPWAYEEGTESMLISPMTASFQDLRRRSSLARSGLVAGRRPGSFGFDPHSYAATRGETDVRSHGLGGTEDRSFPEVPLFDQAVQAAALSLESEASAGDVVEVNSFAFDPALEGEGCESVPSSTYASQYGHASLPSIRSPRASFSGSTLAAAARDWASMKRRRSKLEHQRSIEPFSESVSTSTESLASDDQARFEAAPRAGDRADSYRPSLEESVERAVMLALGKDTGSGSERGGRNSKIVQQILSSLSAELSLQQLPAYPRELGSTSPAPRPMASKPSSSSLAEPSRRSSLRNSCGSLPSYKPSQYGSGSAAARPLPSPLQLIMSNHELSSEAYSHSHPSSQHCN